MSLRLLNVLAFVALAAGGVLAYNGLLVWVILAVGVAVTLAVVETGR